jgi:CTP synthase
LDKVNPKKSRSIFNNFLQEGGNDKSNKYLKDFAAAGMEATGINPTGKMVEIVEIENHPWFVGVQFHPEYSSTVLNPHPLFVEFLDATIKEKV